jgi:hypothetical protein
MRIALALALAVSVVACTDGGDPTVGGSTTITVARPLDDELRLNDVQVLGSHNSYHLQADPPVFDALRAFDASLAESIEYSHPPLDVQLGEQGIRQLEIDVFADPDGGRYASPAGAAFVGVEPDVDPIMLEPGFKVLHIQDIDYRSTCLTFVACLTIVRDWSLANPGHAPLFVMIETKDTPIPDPGLGFVVPPPMTVADFDALDAEIRSVFDDDHVITPDEVRGDHETLDEAVRTDGWPTLGASRGKVLFGHVNGGELRERYLEGHPALEGRMMFTSSAEGRPDAAFVRIDDPVADGDRIRAAVRDGYLVRTRSDADTVEARSGDTTRRDAALASGAHHISSDYAVDDPRFPADFVVAIPGGEPARCNPVRAPEGCTARDVEDPVLLAVE